ncbi:murein biosynthesis integral membrane protein MurJ [Robiginitalea sediminis]|uniref:murein biosynthesis integral membrane protein MurJ n=1 Tax=Robiginitalea sediminis TaxID=1982593 RepID=UPI000B4BC4EB|nr:lipid II flippase MurJ [Robiginitalea sediminis]
MPGRFQNFREVLKPFFQPGLFLNMLVVGSVVFLVKIVAFFKETLVGSTFGLSEFLDTYFIALLIPSFVQTVFIGALKQLFVPNYIYEISSTRKIREFQSFTVLCLTALAAFISLCVLVLVYFFLEEFFAGHTASYYDLVRKQFYLVLPCMLLWAYSGFLSSLLEIENKFFLSTISGIFTPMLTILFVLFMRDTLGDYVLAYGLLCGTGVEFTFLLIIALRRKMLSFGPIRLNDNMRTMLRQYPAKLTSGFLTGVNNFVDQFFASQMVVGSLATIKYGIKIPTFVVGIMVLAIGNVLLPHFSRLMARDLRKARELLKKILLLVFGLGAFVCTILILLSYDIIALVFERGAFDAEDTSVVGALQQIALIYVPFYLCTLVCVKYLTAANRNAFMAWVSFWNMLLNLALNYILIKLYGIYGLVLATTIVYIICSFIYVTYSLKGKFNHTTPAASN